METITQDLTTTIDGYLAAYGEPDAGRRAELVARVWAADGELVDPPAAAQGHEGIASMGDMVQEHFAGHRFRRTTASDVHHDVARFGWELVAADGTVAMAGQDFCELGADGRLRRVVGFFGEPVPAG